MIRVPLPPPPPRRLSGPHVLVVEDESTSAILIRAVTLRHVPGASVTVVGDGQDAIDYLSRVPPYHSTEIHPFPDLILLDLGLPVLSGFGVLEWMAEHPETLAAPVVVFSGSGDPSDAVRAYALGARAFLRKTANPTELVRVMGDVLRRWATGVRDGTLG
jgi:CheY-like chemotaxis protein